MKKAAVAVTAAFLAASAVPAMALDAKFSGEFRTRGEYFNEHFLENRFYQDFDLGEGKSEGSKKTTLWDSRMRLKMDLAVNENLKGVYVMQVGDITWGSNGGNNAAIYPSLRGGLFADRRLRKDQTGGGLNANGINVQSKNMYIDFNLPSTPVNAKVGILPLKLGHSIVLDADVSGLVAQAKTDAVNVGAATFKAYEGNLEKQDDSDYYLLFVNASLHNAGSVGLFGVYNRNRRGNPDGSDTFDARAFNNSTDNANIGDRLTQYWLGLTGDLTLDPIFINAELDGYWAKINRPDNPEDDDHVDGYTAYLNIGANVKPAKVGVAGLYATGQANNTKHPHYFSPILPTNPQDKTILDWDTIVLGQLKRNVLTNLVSAKIYADVSPKDDLTVGISGQSYWLQNSIDKPGRGNHSYLGTEADANVSVRIYDNLVYKISGAYMWTNSDVFGIEKGDTVAAVRIAETGNATSYTPVAPPTPAAKDYKHQDVWYLGHQIVYNF